MKKIIFILLFISTNIYSQEYVVGYFGYDNHYHLNCNMATYTNNALSASGYNTPTFDSYILDIINDTEYTVQLHGYYNGIEIIDRIVLTTSGGSLTTTPAGTSYTSCEQSNCLCLVCKKDSRGNCNCTATSTCENQTGVGCESRTYGNPIDVSNIVRNWLLNQ